MHICMLATLETEKSVYRWGRTKQIPGTLAFWLSEVVLTRFSANKTIKKALAALGIGFTYRVIDPRKRLWNDVGCIILPKVLKCFGSNSYQWFKAQKKCFKIQVLADASCAVNPFWISQFMISSLFGYGTRIRAI